MKKMLPYAVFAGLLVTVGVAGLVMNRYADQQNAGQTALEQAWRSVRQSPHDPRAWTLLGDQQAALDQLSAAEHSYLIALNQTPDDGALAGRLGFLLYGMGRDKEALRYLQQAQRSGAKIAMLDFTLQQLTPKSIPSRNARRPPSPDATALDLQSYDGDQGKDLPEELEPEETENVEEHAHQPPGPAVCEIPVELTSKRGAYAVAAEIDGVPVKLIVDTGASLSALADSFLQDASIAVEEAEPMQAITPTGRFQMETVVVEDVVVAGITATRVRVAVCSDCGGSKAQGLLGLDLLAAMGLELDIQNAKLVIADCQ